MKQLIAKWKRFRERSKGHTTRELVRDFFGRAYMKPAFRRVVRFLVPTRYPDKWVFVVGCYNSGTTLLREMLGSHPDVSSLAREGVKFTDQFPNLQAGGWQRMLLKNKENWEMPRSNIKQRTKKIIRDWSPMWKMRRRVFLEKSIEHAVRMDWLEEAFDSPYFITIVRNGYCVCEGVRRKAAPHGPATKEVGASEYPISLAAQQWVAINEKIEEQISDSRRVYRISYEELVTSPLETLEKLFSFLGLEQPVMEFKNGLLKIDGNVFKIRNMNPESYGRLADDEIKVATEVMHEWLTHYGYLPKKESTHG